MIPDEEPFLLEHKIVDRCSTLKVDSLKSFKIIGADGRHFRWGNAASKKECDKDFILKSSNVLFSYFRRIPHLGLRTDLPTLYEFLRKPWFSCFIFYCLFLLVSPRHKDLKHECTLFSKVFKDFWTIMSDDVSICFINRLFFLTRLMDCCARLLSPLKFFCFLEARPKSLQSWS